MYIFCLIPTILGSLNESWKTNIRILPEFCLLTAVLKNFGCSLLLQDQSYFQEMLIITPSASNINASKHFRKTATRMCEFYNRLFLLISNIDAIVRSMGWLHAVEQILSFFCFYLHIICYYLLLFVNCIYVILSGIRQRLCRNKIYMYLICSSTLVFSVSLYRWKM